jgi:hypothetical protein
MYIILPIDPAKGMFLSFNPYRIFDSKVMLNITSAGPATNI